MRQSGVICSFLIVITFGCYETNACETIIRNIGNIKSVTNTLNTIFEPLRAVIPVFDNITVPNLSKIIYDFQIGLNNEDVHLNITQLLQKYGYPVETHEVKTSDGYLLNMFRIPRDGPPVFLMHGVLCSSDDFVTPGVNNALAYLLADANYDVWMGNARGNKHSRRHEHLSPNCAEFWDFSFDEIGRYDLPAMIDYVLKITNQSELIYVGHSQGTTAFFVMGAERPEYNKKISLMIALSGVVFTGNIRSPVRILCKTVGISSALAKAVGFYEYAPSDAVIETISSIFCGNAALSTIFCSNLIFAISGFDYQQINATNLPVLFSHFPAGSSTQQAWHYAQITNKGKFVRYDRGLFENMERYGTVSPPEYPLHKVTCPVALFYSINDWVTSAIDTEKLLSHLPNVVEFYQVPFPTFNHFDYLWAKDAKVLVNYEVIRLIDKYTK